MKNKFKFLATMLIGILLSTNVWGEETVTYSASSMSNMAWEISTSGTAPTGSSVSCTQTYSNTFGQATAGNSFTMTLSNFSANVTKLTFSLHSNSSKGKGNVSYSVDGGTEVFLVGTGTTSNVEFNTWGDNTQYGTNYRNVNFNVSVSPASSLVINVRCVGENSIYFNGLTVTYTAAAPSNPYTVTFYTASGVSQAITEVSAGAGVTPPSMEQTCGDYTFAGWSKTQRLTEVTTATTIETLTTGKYYPTANTTLYPIYSKTGGGTSDFSLSVTSGSFRISSGGNYATGDISGTSNGKYSSTTDVSNARMFTFTKVSDGVYTIYDESKKDYVKYSSSTDLAYNNGTAYNWTITADGSLWNLASGTSGRYFSYRNDTGVFGGYASTTGEYSNVSITGTSSTYYFSYPSCASCTNTITITKGAESNGTFTLSRSGNNVCIDDDATIIVSNITPAEHYHIAEVTTTNGTVTGPEDGKYTVTVTDDATIGVTFEQDAKVTVTWNANGVETTTEVFPGETAAAPANPENIPTCANTFMGWSTSTLTGTGHSAPADLFSTTSPEITAAITFNAVFAKAEGSGEELWTKVTDLTQVGEGEYAILVDAENPYAFSGTVNSSGHGESTSQIFNFDSNGQATSAPEGTCVLTIAAVENGYTMYCAGKGYLYAKAASSGNLAWSNSAPSRYWNTHTKNDVTNWSYYGTTNSEPWYAHIRMFSTTLRTYGSNNGSAVIFVKKGTGTTYSNYVTTCATYTVTWMSNGFEIRKDENKAPGAVLAAPTVSEVRTVSAKAACGDHLVGWMPAASTTNPKVKQDDAPAGMVGQQVTVTDNVVYHAVYADVAGE